MRWTVDGRPAATVDRSGQRDLYGVQSFVTHGRHGRSAQHTFLFADLVGFTAFTERVGDEAAADVAVAFQTAAAHLAADFDCEVVKSLGDAVMIHGDDAARVVALALRIARELVDGGLVPAAAHGRALRHRRAARRRLVRLDGQRRGAAGRRRERRRGAHQPHDARPARRRAAR